METFSVCMYVYTYMHVCVYIHSLLQFLFDCPKTWYIDSLVKRLFKFEDSHRDEMTFVQNITNIIKIVIYLVFSEGERTILLKNNFNNTDKKHINHFMNFHVVFSSDLISLIRTWNFNHITSLCKWLWLLRLVVWYWNDHTIFILFR